MQIRRAADFVDGNNVRMLHARGVLRFALESIDEAFRCPRTGRQQFHRDFAIQTALIGAIDHAHAAFADQFLQFVAAEFALLRIVEIEFQRVGGENGQMPAIDVRQVGGETAEGQVGHAVDAHAQQRIGGHRADQAVALRIHNAGDSRKILSNAACSFAKSSAEVTVSDNSCPASSRMR